jgi:hypothetical protein
VQATLIAFEMPFQMPGFAFCQMLFVFKYLTVWFVNNYLTPPLAFAVTNALYLPCDHISVVRLCIVGTKYFGLILKIRITAKKIPYETRSACCHFDFLLPFWVCPG